MIRKTIIAIAAVGTLAAAALAPTSASAWGFKGGWGHHGWGHGVGIGFWGPGYVDYTPDCYLVKKVYRSGAVKYVQVCN
jgi:hypothetical protein